MKGGINMSLKKTFLIVGLMVALVMGISAAQVYAGEPAPGADEKIIGPTMWAVGVVDCSSTPFGTLRVKKIDGCNVDEDALSGEGTELGITVCPENAAQVLYARLPQGSVFGLQCVPIITKVKNFKNEGSIVSFDAQIQFVVPAADPRTECQ
jgi:hypothetical protein